MTDEEFEQLELLAKLAKLEVFWVQPICEAGFEPVSDFMRRGYLMFLKRTGSRHPLIEYSHRGDLSLEEYRNALALVTAGKFDRDVVVR